jgi:segregation and condensation protein B
MDNSPFDKKEQENKKDVSQDWNLEETSKAEESKQDTSSDIISLNEALEAWAPDHEKAAGSRIQTLSEPTDHEGPLALVSDPFHSESFMSDAEASEDFNQDFNEDFNEDLEENRNADEPEENLRAETKTQAETEDHFNRLASAVETQTAKDEAEMKGLVKKGNTKGKASLKKQIQEDNEVEKENQASLQEEAQEAAQAEEIDPEFLAALPGRDEQGNLDMQELQACMETLIFLTQKPIPLKKLKEFLAADVDMSVFEEAVRSLQERYEEIHHGIELVEVAGGFQFRTKVNRGALIRKLSKIQRQRLSRGAMETLAIIAYRQPALKDDVDKVRGVDSSHFIRNLLDKKLVAITGRSELPGRPMLYSTTDEFLEIFGLKELSALPPLRELEQMVPSSESDNPENEDPKVIEMRKLVQQMKEDRHRIKYDPKEDDEFLSDIRDRVKEISDSTPYLEEQKALEKQAALEAKEAKKLPQPDLPHLEAQPKEARLDESPSSEVQEGLLAEESEETEFSH